MIRWPVRFAALGVLGLVAIWTIVSLSVKERSTPGPEEELIDPADASAQKLLCGPRNLCIALRRLGIPTRLEALTKDIRLTESGVAMHELVRLVSSIAQVNAERTSLTWNELAALNATAILLVNDNHFVGADPRENEQTPRDEKHRIRIYDEGKPSRWVTRAELAAIWDGEAIVLRRKSGATEEGSRIEWKHCLIDAGCLKRNDITQHRFQFRNVGSAVLQIESIKKSCSCAGYEVYAREIPPGQSGWIEGTMRLTGCRGKFSSFLLITTNDPYSSDVVLVMEAFVYNDHILSQEAAHFGQIPQGEARGLKVFVHDPGEENLRVLDTQIQLSTRQTQRGDIRASLELVAVEQACEYVGVMGAYPVKVGDYLIRPMITVDTNCPVGPFTGKMFITTNLKSPLDHIEMLLDGDVVPHVYSWPSTVMLTLGPDGQTRETICLQSTKNRQFDVLKVWTDNSTLISVKPLSGQKGDPRYEIKALPATVDPTERLVQTTIHFQLNEGSALDVPVLIYRKW